MRSFITLLTALCCSITLFSQELAPLFNPPIFSKASITQATLDSEGYIYFTGSFDLVDREPRFGISKLNADGSLNADFNIGTGFNGDIFRLVSLSTDKLLIIGNFTEYKGVATGPMVRINGDGSIDEEFTKATSIESPIENPITNVIELTDGKLLVYGRFTNYNGLVTNSIAVLNQDGTVNDTFNYEDENVVSVSAVAAQSSGKLVLHLNKTDSQPGLIARLNADGTKDETFNDFDSGNSPVYKIMAQSTDKLLVLADFPEGDELSIDLIRLNADGDTDDSFDLGTGIVGFFDDFQLNGDDEILIGSGYTETEEGGSIDGNSIGLISRLEPDGAFGSSFASGLSGDSSRVALGKNDEVAIYGRFLSVEDHATRGIAVFSDDEVKDTDFITDIRRVAETSIVTGTGFSRVQDYTYIIPRNPEEIDSLGRGGVYHNYTGRLEASIDIEIDLPEIRVFKSISDAGYVVAGGPAGSEPIFRMLFTDDRGYVFNSEDYRFNDNWVNQVVNGSAVFAAGSFSGYNGITDGVAGILRFGIGEVAGAGMGNVDHDFVSPLRADSVNITDAEYRGDNGQLVIVGVFAPADSPDAELINGIARLNYDGSFDETFDWSNHFSGGIIQQVEIVEDGYIIVGDFTAPRKGIAKINQDGSLNSEFNADDSFLFNKIAGAEVFGNDIYVGGDLTEYQGKEVYGLMKLDLDGNLDDSFKLPSTLSAKVNDIDINHTITLAGLFYDSIQNRKLSAVRLGVSPDAAPTDLSFSYEIENNWHFVNLSWTDMSNNEEGFIVEVSHNNQNDFNRIRQTSANTTAEHHNPTESGSTYYYRVAAFKGNQISEYSNTVEVAVPQSPLAAPTDLRIYDIEINEVFFGWDHTATEEEGFVIEKSESDQQNFVAIDSVEVNTTHYRDLSVEAGAIYFYRIRAFKGSEHSSEYSNVIEVEMPQTANPAAPTNLTGSLISANRLDLTWTDNSSNEDIFVVEKSVDQGQEWKIIATPNKNVTSFSDTEVEPGQPAAYYIWAMNSWGVSENSNIFQINMPSPPAAPSSLTGIIVSGSQIDLSWTDNSDNEANFVIARTVDQGELKTIGTVPTGQTSYSDTDVEIGQTLEYSVWARNGGGSSPASNPFQIYVTSIGEGGSNQNNRFDFTYDPISKELGFKLNSPSDKIRGYQVVSSSGVIKMREEGLETQQLNLSLSGNTTGIYILHVTSERDKYVVKFIKN